MSEIETIEVHEVAEPRRAPVELAGRVVARRIEWFTDALKLPCSLVLRPSTTRGSHWRTGMIRMTDGDYDLRQIVANADGDYVYRIGTPLTPSLEERVAMLERRIYRDLIVADDAEKSGRPEVARELRSKVEWWRDPPDRLDGDRTVSDRDPCGLCSHPRSEHWAFRCQGHGAGCECERFVSERTVAALREFAATPATPGSRPETDGRTRP